MYNYNICETKHNGPDLYSEVLGSNLGQDPSYPEVLRNFPQ
jgi:hypothetical protein